MTIPESLAPPRGLSEAVSTMREGRWMESQLAMWELPRVFVEDVHKGVEIVLKPLIQSHS